MLGEARPNIRRGEERSFQNGAKDSCEATCGQNTRKKTTAEVITKCATTVQESKEEALSICVESLRGITFEELQMSQLNGALPTVLNG